jgi:hypothetical protein
MKLNFVTFIWLDFTENPGSSQRTRTQTDPGSRLADPVDDEDVEEIVHELILQTSDKWSKETEEY